MTETEIQRTLGAVEKGLDDMLLHMDTRMDAMSKHIDTRMDAFQAQMIAHDSRVVQITARVHALETWRAKVMGVVVGVGAVAGLVANWIGKKLGL